jgi:nitroimidazol reductase NimA-like FMN-containing flavoprotein (pyridoxamine 5'-phosphate oxidase superfamily)
MAVIDGRTGLEMIPSKECWRLLETRSVGRIGVVVDEQPEIIPVNYVVVDSAVLFRTEGGTKLHALETHRLVAFEADDFDARARTGWSVLVKGRAEEIRDPAALRQLRAMALEPWAAGEHPHWIRIVPFEITGRRIRHR